MPRVITRAAMLACALLPLTGCGIFNLGPWGGPAYQLDTDKIGTGQAAITPRNDPWYMNGEPMDTRHSH